MFRLSMWLRREWANLMLVTVLVGLLGNSLLAAMGPRDLLLLRERRADLEDRRAELQMQQAVLQTSVRNLRSNDRYLEHLIRTELGYARSDEMVYKFTAPAESDSRDNLGRDARIKARRSRLAGLALQLLSQFGIANR